MFNIIAVIDSMFDNRNDEIVRTILLPEIHNT